MDITIIATVATGVATIFGSWFVTRSRAQNDSFNSIIKANEQFREEIREDLQESKNDLEAAGQIMESLRKEVETLRIDLSATAREIERLSVDLKLSNIEREKLVQLVKIYEREIIRLKEVILQYEATAVDSTTVISDLKIEINRLQAKIDVAEAKILANPL